MQATCESPCVKVTHLHALRLAAAYQNLTMYTIYVLLSYMLYKEEHVMVLPSPLYIKLIGRTILSIY